MHILYEWIKGIFFLVCTLFILYAVVDFIINNSKKN
jgi:hypothetical protein